MIQRRNLKSKRVGMLSLIIVCFGVGSLLLANAITFPKAASSKRVVKRIEEVKTGDWVLAKDQDLPNSQLQPYRVDETYIRTSSTLRVVKIVDAAGSHGILQTTDTHPFWTSERGWVNAKDLKAGEHLKQEDGRAAVVGETSVLAEPGGTTVYNFRVAGAHTYFVFANDGAGSSVWVHNANYSGTGQAPKPLGRGTTGRTAPQNLQEKLSMEAAMADPVGQGIPAPSGGGMKDPRWSSSDGWVKMRNKDNSVHWVQNANGDVDDFKFKD